MPRERAEKRRTATGNAINAREKLVEQQRRIRELEETLERAERSERNKSDFLVSLGHALRTPLHGIMGMTDLVLESSLGAEQRSRLEMASTSAERLLEVVNDLLDYCRIEAGSLRLAAEDFNLAESLEYELYLLQLAARQKKLDFASRIDPLVPVWVNSDPDRLVQVLVNLVDNAIKNTERGGVGVRVEYLGEAGAEQILLKFTVTDSGSGIALEKQAGIEAYLRDGNYTADRPSCDSGLGLTIAARLVHLTGGEIGFQSTPGKGAMFWFTWACRHAARPSERSEQPPQKRLPADTPAPAMFQFDGASVLLVEDEPISRVLIETLLNQVGLQVGSAENGRQAVTAALSGRYRAVLMDVQMPGMDGLEATRAIRTHEKAQGGHLPIIALTAHAMQGDRDRCLQAGMDDYLAKPLNKDDLYQVLSRHLTRAALIVLGEMRQQQAAVEYLVEKGWRVTIAETVRSAGYEASLHHFDLVVLDVDHDGGEGAETVRTIRRLEAYSGRHSLILAIRGEQATPAMIDIYRQSGVDRFLEPPFSARPFNTCHSPGRSL
jgi:signal transduction histidine kinase/CheY-like chemotaxis protein